MFSLRWHDEYYSGVILRCGYNSAPQARTHTPILVLVDWWERFDESRDDYALTNNSPRTSLVVHAIVEVLSPKSKRIFDPHFFLNDNEHG